MSSELLMWVGSFAIGWLIGKFNWTYITRQIHFRRSRYEERCSGTIF
jgi:hypothetical protein